MWTDNNKVANQSILTVTGDFDHSKLSRLIDPLVSPDGPDNLVIDFRNVTFVSPLPVVSLITMLSSDVVSNKDITFLCPRDSSRVQYLAACGFLQHARKWISIEGAGDLVEALPSRSASTLLPLTCLDSKDDIEQIIHSVRSGLDSLMGHSSQRSVKKAIQSTIQELTANIFDHARTDIGWIYAQEYFNRYQQKSYVQIAIGDAGCGIRKSLATRFDEFDDINDSEALRRMLLEELSRRTSGTGGTGYQVLKKAAKENDGRFSLRSGTGEVKQYRGSNNVNISDSTSSWPGTQLFISITYG